MSFMTPAALEEYYENIQKLSSDYPECWHLVMQAEDRCRGEHLERVYRKLMSARLEGRQSRLQRGSAMDWCFDLCGSRLRVLDK